MSEDGEIDARIATFRADVVNLDALAVIGRHIMSGSPYALTPDQHYELKSVVADQFKPVHHSEVIVVGSAKLGFSIAPHKRYAHFGDKSDIDLAIVSSGLFEKVWVEAFDHWRSGGYWEGQRDFEKYFFRGWIRPDKFPPSRYFATAKDWWEFFRLLTQSRRFGPYKIRAGLYHSWHFLEHYHVTAVQQCAQDV